MKIEKIVIVKNGYEVYVTGKKFFVYEDVLLKYELLLRKKVSESLVEEILRENRFYEMYLKGLKFLRLKMRSVYEVQEYFRKEGYGSRDIQRVIERYENEGYLSDEYKMTTSAASPKDFMENDTKFHMAIVSFSGNEQMLKIMTDMRSRIDRVGVKSLGMDGRMYNTYREHKEIVKTIKEGNRAEVYKAIEFHFDTCRALMSGGK